MNSLKRFTQAMLGLFLVIVFISAINKCADYDTKSETTKTTTKEDIIGIIHDSLYEAEVMVVYKTMVKFYPKMDSDQKDLLWSELNNRFYDQVYPLELGNALIRRGLNPLDTTGIPTPNSIY